LERFDVIVVGAGTAGCLAAKTTAEAGLKVCMIERKRREEIGEKICGDALGEHHLKTVGLEKPQGAELEKRIEGVKVYSPNLETVFTIVYEDYVGYMLNRRLFGQWLLRKALDKGAILFDSTQCVEPIIEKSFVTGILARNLKIGRNIRLTGKVILDASGFLAVVRRKLPEEMGIENNVANEDVEACYREIRQLKEENEKTEYCEIYLNQEVTPGGYAWIFHKGGPYFIPWPPPIFGIFGIGTFGAVIMQKSLPPNKDSLFDVGSSGPIISFIMAAVFSVLGLLLSIPAPPSENLGVLPPTLLWTILHRFLLGLGLMPQPPVDKILLVHPVALAGWFGMLLTMLQLLPAAMLDGGHVARSIVGEKTRNILTLLSIVLLIVEGFWPMAFFVLLMSMYKHPGPLDDVSSLSPSRKFLTIVLIGIFVLCSFQISPIF
jgi:Dehydrogenases (flavoproteins)